MPGHRPVGDRLIRNLLGVMATEGDCEIGAQRSAHSRLVEQARERERLLALSMAAPCLRARFGALLD